MARIAMQGWVFGGFQYPTPPLRARGSLDRHAAAPPPPAPPPASPPPPAEPGGRTSPPASQRCQELPAAAVTGERTPTRRYGRLLDGGHDGVNPYPNWLFCVATLRQ
jgi:hypothetical protein